ncbi:MAG: hypothetical protein HXK59_02205, partial [Campylobacter concisus]|nr:hypothetical protein [Campylobacter concisus]
MKILNLAFTATCVALLLGCTTAQKEPQKLQSSANQKSYLVSYLPQNI